MKNVFDFWIEQTRSLSDEATAMEEKFTALQLRDALMFANTYAEHREFEVRRELKGDVHVKN